MPVKHRIGGATFTARGRLKTERRRVWAPFGVQIGWATGEALPRHDDPWDCQDGLPRVPARGGANVINVFPPNSVGTLRGSHL